MDKGDSLRDRAEEPYDDYCDEDVGECWNCGGDGFVYGCSWDWQCDTWDGDSCLCTRPCHICHPPKPNSEMAAVIRRAWCQRCAGEGVLYRQDCGAHGLTAPCPDCTDALCPTGDAPKDGHHD